MSKKILTILLFFCLSAGLVCLIGMSRELLIYRNADSLYETMAEDIEADRGVQAKEDGVSGQGEAFSYEALDFDELEKKFPDIRGWIRSEDGELNYPVVQRDNNEYYLNHLPDGSGNKVGSLFLDCNSRADFSSSVSVIYGHHVKNGMMFGYLDRYREQKFYDENPCLYLYTKDKNYKLELAAAYLVDGTSGAYPFSFDNGTQLKTYLEKAGKKSFFQGRYQVEEGDRLVILSTCAYDFDNARLAVACLLREDNGE